MLQFPFLVLELERIVYIHQLLLYDHLGRDDLALDRRGGVLRRGDGRLGRAGFEVWGGCPDVGGDCAEVRGGFGEGRRSFADRGR